jgi:hypothetical protein
MLRLVCFSLDFTLIWKLVINSWRFTGCCLLLKYDVYLFLSVSSRHSRSLAEDAFFHPSIMSISYYSFEHCFAIYSVRPLTLLLTINTTIYNVTFLTIPSYWPDYIYILTFIIREYRLCIYLPWKHNSCLFWQDFYHKRKMNIKELEELWLFTDSHLFYYATSHFFCLLQCIFSSPPYENGKDSSKKIGSTCLGRPKQKLHLNWLLNSDRLKPVSRSLRSCECPLSPMLGSFLIF